MDFGKAFTYQFEDTEWIKKLVIMGLIALIPVVGQLVVMGWMIDIIKKMINHEPMSLPTVDFGGQLSRGFGAFVVGLVYALPIFVVAMIQGGVMALLGGMTGSESSAADAGGILIVILSLCIGLIYLLYSIVLVFLLPMAYGRYAEFGKIGDALKVGEVFKLSKKVVGPVLVVLLGSIVASFVASLGSIACGVGIIVTSTYAMAAMGHLYGQVYNLAKATA